jgi:hypothetical protein
MKGTSQRMLTRAGPKKTLSNLGSYLRQPWAAVRC